PAGAVCEIMNEDGTMARRPQLDVISAQFGIKIISVAQLIEYRRRREKLVRRLSSVTLPTRFGDFQATVYEDVIRNDQHVALTFGEPGGDEAVLVRRHSECLTGHVYESPRCGCGEQRDHAMQMIAKQGRDVI